MGEQNEKVKKERKKSEVDFGIINQRRRNLIKYTLFGGIGFLAGRYLDPLVNTLRGDAVINAKNFENFKLTETGKQLRITDDENNDLLLIDKDAF